MSDRLRIEEQRWSSNPREPAHVHKRDRVVISRVVRAGSFQVGQRRSHMQRYWCARGDLKIHERNVSKWVVWETRMEAVSLVLPDSVLADVAGKALGDRVSVEPVLRHRDQRLQALMQAAEIEHRLGYPSDRLFLDSVAQAISTVLLGPRPNVRSEAFLQKGGLSPRQLRMVTEYVQAHLAQDVSLADMAETTELSQSHFCRAFKSSTGMTPHQFLLDLRISQAKHLLAGSAERVLDVALACGFKTQQHFARVFKALSGGTPSEFRRGAE